MELQFSTAMPRGEARVPALPMPVASFLVQDAEDEINLDRHQDRLVKANIRKSVDDAPPRTTELGHMRRNRKKEMLAQRRLEEIDRDNRILVHRMMAIHSGNGEYNRAAVGAAGNKAKPAKAPVRSLNIRVRLAEAKRIEVENQGIMRRIQDSRSAYKKRDLKPTHFNKPRHLPKIGRRGGRRKRGASRGAGGAAPAAAATGGALTARSAHTPARPTALAEAGSLSARRPEAPRRGAGGHVDTPAPHGLRGGRAYHPRRSPARTIKRRELDTVVYHSAAKIGDIYVSLDLKRNPAAPGRLPSYSIELYDPMAARMYSVEADERELAACLGCSPSAIEPDAPNAPWDDLFLCLSLEPAHTAPDADDDGSGGLVAVLVKRKAASDAQPRPGSSGAAPASPTAPAPKRRKTSNDSEATTIQAAVRRRRASVKVKEKRTEKREKQKAQEKRADKRDKDAAATHLQRLTRGKLARQAAAERKERHAAAAKLQAIARGRNRRRADNTKPLPYRIGIDAGDDHLLLVQLVPHDDADKLEVEALDALSGNVLKLILARSAVEAALEGTDDTEVSARVKALSGQRLSSLMSVAGHLCSEKLGSLLECKAGALQLSSDDGDDDSGPVKAAKLAQLGRRPSDHMRRESKGGLGDMSKIFGDTAVGDTAVGGAAAPAAGRPRSESVDSSRRGLPGAMGRRASSGNPRQVSSRRLSLMRSDSITDDQAGSRRRRSSIPGLAPVHAGAEDGADADAEKAQPAELRTMASSLGYVEDHVEAVPATIKPVTESAPATLQVPTRTLSKPVDGGEGLLEAVAAAL